MLFSSLTFLYIFLPLVLLAYYVIRKKYRNYLLLLASMIFFAWGGVSYSLLLIVSVVFNYFFGRGIAFTRHKRLYLGLGVSLNLVFLGIFKYAGFLTEILNAVLSLSSGSTFPVPEIILPIGISFYTFQAISYLIDLYRKEAEVQTNILNLGLFISLFPQLIAGPIVRYHDISTQINQRGHSHELFARGVIRFMLGLAKKVIIANNLAIIADHVFQTPAAELSVFAAWVGLIAYTFQIYYDFAGYSDMAIGLASMFGFRLLENFDFPYIARSIQEFWRRWHISLSRWFRDYLYIPLGGNRIGLVRTYINLVIVFFITGLWHGSSWNFVVWGLIHGFFLVVERIGFKNVLSKTPAILSQFYTLIIAMMAWVLFRADSFEYAGAFYRALLGLNPDALTDISLLLKINKEFLLALGIAVFGAYGGFVWLKKWILRAFRNREHLLAYLKTYGYALFVIVVFLMTTLYLANSTYNPFIYFRF